MLVTLNVLCHGGSVCKLLLSNLIALNYKALKKRKTGGDTWDRDLHPQHPETGVAVVSALTNGLPGSGGSLGTSVSSSVRGRASEDI